MRERGRRALLALSAALAHGNLPILREAMEECWSSGRGVEAEEVMLQSYLFLGYPVALNAFGLWRQVSGQEPAEGIPDAWEEWSLRGEEVCRRVYGGQYEGLRRNVRSLHPDMERWMVVEGYGKVLGRPQLGLKLRELCIVALLAVLGAPRQLHSHLRGSLNSGAVVTEVEEALDVAGSLTEDARTAEAREIWDRVRDRWRATGGQGVPSDSGEEAQERVVEGIKEEGGPCS